MSKDKNFLYYFFPCRQAARSPAGIPPSVSFIVRVWFNHALVRARIGVLKWWGDGLPVLGYLGFSPISYVSNMRKAVV